MKDKILCLECGKYLDYINYVHLKSCSGLTTKEYMKKYPNIEMVSEKYKLKISKTLKGNKLSDSHKEKIKDNHKGMSSKIHTDESKQKISKAKLGKKHTEEHCKKIGESHKGKKRSEETKQKQRLSAIKRIEERYGQISPNYNPNACKFFDYLNQEFDLEGIHAENGGEFYISELGYWLDYYEPNLNIVIEWDEKYHKYQEEKDKARQYEIEEFLNCKFIRIKSYF